MSPNPKVASLSLQGLSSLPKVDKTRFVSTFVQDQFVHANSYVLQGSGSQWDRVASTVDGVQAQHAFGTPVLKPRVPAGSKLETACAFLKDHSNDLPGSPNVLAEDHIDRTTHNQNKRKRQGSNAVTKRYVPAPNKQIRTQNSKPSLKEADSNIHPEDEQTSRRRERRDRKCIKRAIISPSRSSDVENMSDEKPSKNAKKNSKKAKIPAGFALMHGFAATNVGARRLTIKPSLSIGVFNKGKASAKMRATHKSTKKDRQSTRFSELGFLNKGDRERHKVTEKVISKPRLSDTDSQSPSPSPDQTGDLETQRSKFVITNRRTPNTKRSEKKKRTASSLPGNESKSAASVSNSPSMQARSDLDPLLKATLAESIVWDIEVETGSLLAPVLASEKRSVVLEVCNRPWNVLPKIELVGPNDTHDQLAPRPHTLSDKADDLEPKSPSSSLAPSQSASQNGRSFPRTHGTIPLAGASSKYFSITPNPQASGADHVSVEKPFKRALSKQADETAPACYLDVMPPPNRLQVPDSLSLEDANPNRCLDTHQALQYCLHPGGAPRSQPSSREHSASCLHQPGFDADGGNGPYDLISLELNDPQFTTPWNLEDSVDYCTQNLHLWSSADHVDAVYPLTHDGCGVLADPVLCHSLYDDSGEFGETTSIILESMIDLEIGHSEEYAMDSTSIFGDNQELEPLEEDIATSNLSPDNQDCPECFGGQYETSELNYEQYRTENIDGESLASNSKSFVGNDLDDFYSSDHASAMFSQGRALLMGEGSAVQTRPRQPMLLSMVEADVAKSLKNHWLPQKL